MTLLTCLQGVGSNALLNPERLHRVCACHSVPVTVCLIYVYFMIALQAASAPAEILISKNQQAIVVQHVLTMPLATSSKSYALHTHAS